MASSIAMPEASVARLRASYAQFEQLCQVVLEAMGIDQAQVQTFDLKSGTVVLFEDPPVEHRNGVADAVRVD